MNPTTTAPYWLDYLSRERTHCSPCYAEGRGWVRVIVPTRESNPISSQAGYRSRQRAAFRRHVAAEHPTLRVRWSR